jgi:hypothetical protein
MSEAASLQVVHIPNYKEPSKIQREFLQDYLKTQNNQTKV